MKAGEKNAQIRNNKTKKNRIANRINVQSINMDLRDILRYLV